MNKHSFLTTILTVAISVCFSQQYGSFKDPRDGKVYKIAYVGNQEWMTENLNTDRFQNGDPIPEAKTQEQWKTAYREGKPIWCYYDFDSTNGPNYGKLYNWHAVTDARGLASKGWHIPTDQEVEIFKNTTELVPLNGLNFSDRWIQLGFTIQYSGNCTPEGTFNNLESHACWWTTDEDQTNSWNKFGIGMYSGYDSPSDLGKQFGFPVRCIKKLDDLLYTGHPNKQIFSKLTVNEQALFRECLEELNADSASVVWASNKSLKKIKRNSNYFRSVTAQKSTITENNEIEFVTTKGKIRLKQPQYVFIIDRKNGSSIVKVQEIQ